MDASQRDTLIGIARAALEAAVTGRDYEPDAPADPFLHERRGCFVTLKTAGQLRGCLGCFTSDEPLYRAVAAYARRSAREDPRFAGQRIGPDELPAVELDISVLSPLEPCEDPYAIEPGVHGIYVRQGFRSGCFLPQVATETGWPAEQFWSMCCAHKAGLPPDAWKTDAVERFVFTADVLYDPPPDAS